MILLPGLLHQLSTSTAAKTANSYTKQSPPLKSTKHDSPLKQPPIESESTTRLTNQRQQQQQQHKQATIKHCCYSKDFRTWIRRSFCG